MIAMGLYYVREAETIDDEFSELLGRPGGRDAVPAREPAVRPLAAGAPERAGPAPLDRTRRAAAERAARR
jgi:hypothetical protein